MRQYPTLETDRLLLRPFDLRDATDVQCLAGDRAIADTTGKIPHPYENGIAEEWISKHFDEFIQGTGVYFAITKKIDGALIGAVSLTGIVKDHQAVLGYWIGKPFWNQGFCTEAGHAALSYGFTVLRLKRIHSCYITRNPASGRVMEKLGMQYEGCRKNHVVKWGKLEDLALYGILKADWERQTDKREG